MSTSEEAEEFAYSSRRRQDKFIAAGEIDQGSVSGAGRGGVARAVSAIKHGSGRKCHDGAVEWRPQRPTDTGASRGRGGGGAETQVPEQLRHPQLRYSTTGMMMMMMIILYFKMRSVCPCALRSQRALTLYTQRQTALLRPIYPVSAVIGS